MNMWMLRKKINPPANNDLQADLLLFYIPIVIKTGMWSE